MELNNDFEVEAPIEYCHSNRGYYYTEENYRLPAITITGTSMSSAAISMSNSAPLMPGRWMSRSMHLHIGSLTRS